MEGEGISNLPLHITHKILEHISDPASIARAASTCKLWRDIVKDRKFLDGLRKRHLNHGFTPSLLLGLFYQGSADIPEHLWRHKRDHLAPMFRPTSQLFQFTGHKDDYTAAEPLPLSTFMQDIGSSLNFYEPIASQDGFLVLCYRSQECEVNPRSDLIRVCNPLAGSVFHIPDLPLPSVPPDHYVLLVTDDVSITGRRSQSFQLVFVWVRGNKLIYFYYCSKTSTWTKSGRIPELLSGLYLASSPTAASHGRVHWLCGSWKSGALSHVVTLRLREEELSYVELPSEAKCSKASLIGKSSNGDLLLISMKGFQMLLWKHNCGSFSGARRWVLSETIDMTSFLPLRALKIYAGARVRLDIFRGKSGVVVFWIEKEGLFYLSLSDRSLRKIDNAHIKNRYYCPYEMDWLSCLAVTNLVVDGSLSNDAGREKVRSRWRTLVAKIIKKKAEP